MDPTLDPELEAAAEEELALAARLTWAALADLARAATGRRRAVSPAA